MARHTTNGKQRAAHLRLTFAALAGAGVGGALAYRALRGDRHPQHVRGARIVIAGAGFGGTHVARTLARLLPRTSEVSVTLIDCHDFQLFTPMLTEVAGGELEKRHVVAPLHSLPDRIAVVQGQIERIDLATKSVVYRPPEGGTEKTISADHLVMALGATTTYHDIPGVQAHSIAMNTVADAVSVRDHVVKCLEAANVEQNATKRRRLLTFVVAGGGFTGVETAGAINALVRAAASEYSHVAAQDISVELVEPSDRLLEQLSADLADYAKTELEKHGVQVRLRTKIASADDEGIVTDPHGRIETSTFIWAGGVRPNPLVETLDCERGKHGGIIVDHTCAVPRHPGVWAVGDCAEIPKADERGSYAPTAQNATREGALVAENIVAALTDQPPRSFAYEPIGEAAVIGRHTAVAKLYGYRFSGVAAWAMWRAIYVSKMPTVSQRARIVGDWVLDALFGRLDVAVRSTP